MCNGNLSGIGFTPTAFQNVIESFQPYPLQNFKTQPLEFY